MGSYQTSLEQDRAIREHAAIGTVAPRGQIAVSGKDRATYLQGLLTNDIQTLTAGQGCYAAWLTPQGRMLSDLHVLESGDMMLLDVPADQVVPTMERLDQFLFSEDVQLASLAGSLTGVWVHGPVAPRVLADVLDGLVDPAGWPDYRNARASFDGSPVVVARIDQLGVPGFCIYLEPARADAFVEALAAAGAASVDPAVIEAARIEARYPVFGADMTDDTIPLEAGIETRAISFTKGCYVGQEVVIRVLHRGQGRVARRLVGLIVDGEPPAHGAKLWSGEREVGFITSAAASPRLTTIALGYLHRDFVEPGTKVEVDAPRGRVTAAVR